MNGNTRTSFDSLMVWIKEKGLRIKKLPIRSTERSIWKISRGGLSEGTLVKINTKSGTRYEWVVIDKKGTSIQGKSLTKFKGALQTLLL